LAFSFFGGPPPPPRAAFECFPGRKSHFFFFFLPFSLSFFHSDPFAFAFDDSLPLFYSLRFRGPPCFFEVLTQIPRTYFRNPAPSSKNSFFQSNFKNFRFFECQLLSFLIKTKDSFPLSLIFSPLAEISIFPFLPAFCTHGKRSPPPVPQRPPRLLLRPFVQKAPFSFARVKATFSFFLRLLFFLVAYTESKLHP